MIQGFGIFEVCCIWQLFKKVFQIPFGVQVVGFGCFNQAVDDGTGFGSLGAVTEKPVFSPNGERSDAVFRGVVGNVTVTVLEITGQPVTVRQEIIHGRYQRRFGQQFIDIVFCVYDIVKVPSVTFKNLFFTIAGFSY